MTQKFASFLNASSIFFIGNIVPVRDMVDPARPSFAPSAFLAEAFAPPLRRLNLPAD